jgi:hypothetical protein
VPQTTAPAGAGRSPELEILGIALADRAGCESVETAAIAREFAREFAEDFDAVLTLACDGRSPAALAGDLAQQLGLRLEGTLEQNVARLREFCEPRRFLIVLEDAQTPEALEFGFQGRCSTLLSPGDAVAGEPDPLREIQSALQRLTAPWTDLCSLAREGRRRLRDAGRLAELYELMQQWHAAAKERNDRNAIDESARELVWILEGWGLNDEARLLDYHRASECEDQMMLPFA